MSGVHAWLHCVLTQGGQAGAIGSSVVVFVPVSLSQAAEASSIAMKDDTRSFEPAGSASLFTNMRPEVRCMYMLHF